MFKFTLGSKKKGAGVRALFARLYLSYFKTKKKFLLPPSSQGDRGKAFVKIFCGFLYERKTETAEKL